MKVVINACFGGFGLSDAAYEKLIEWGVPVRAYKDSGRDPETGLYMEPSANKGEVIFDRKLTGDYRPGSHIFGRYWDAGWLDDKSNRHNPLLVRVVEELGEEASDSMANLKIVEIPDGTDYIIDEYDGNEHIAEAHRTWYA